MMKQKRYGIGVALLCMAVAFGGCTAKPVEGSANEVKPTEQMTEVDETTTEEAGVVKLETNPVVTMVIKDYGTITLELYPDKAPNTVNNFVTLANSGFYDGLIFHRIIEGFMIQGGDPDGVGTGGPGYSIVGEFSGNGYEANDIEHTKGVISMARSRTPDSAGSQFFIMSADAPHLDGQYAAFGEVTDGLDIVEALEKVATNGSDKPVEDVIIESVTVDTHGEQVPTVVKNQ